MFTAPAYFMSGLVLTSIFLMSKHFKPVPRQKEAAKTTAKRLDDVVQSYDDHANRLTCCLGQLSVYDCCILGCMVLNVSTKGSISTFETLGISYGMSHFGMEPSQAGTIVATCGSMGVVALLWMSTSSLAKSISDIHLISFGMVVMATGFASLTVGAPVDANQGGINSDISWKFASAVFMIYSIGYPIGHTAVLGLFSKST